VSTTESLSFFAACPRHVPDLLATELRGLGLEVTREFPAGVAFTGSLRDGYLACLASRLASRVLLTLAPVPLESPEAMYEAIRALPWEEHLAPEGTLAIDVVGQAPSWLRHTQFAAQKAKDAIVDRLRERHGERPSVDLANPDLRLNLSLMRDRGSMAIDLAGEPLHRRGYRQSGVEAPLKENLAAALLMRCGWPAIAAAGGAFADPMCGSGTLVIEAALMAAGIALWDVVGSCVRPGSLDAAIDDDTIVANDFAGFLARHRRIGRVCFNGRKAESAWRRHVQPRLPPARKFDCRLLPSTSPAHAGMGYLRKLRIWRSAITC